MKQVQNTARLALGIFFGLIGMIGIILPLIPGTPFLLLAAACFSGLEEETTADPVHKTEHQTVVD
ncbi:DUF454 family protein [Synechococcus sp. PCC 6312]|uniref:DUF454 family protein n=1 Tax=Synechococcus sp. (strain ATCC 27167 / PCC 6312) TaxID=195253 RepID=UPI00029ECD75|nr:DUF454 family protein [Synechococcus sp. PCC 6312]AFY60462.1 hypothetical protein Syn6312_1281 [Synechococcus sp. PCC 6312]